MYDNIFSYVKNIHASEVITKIEMKKSDVHIEEKSAPASKKEIPKKQSPIPPKENVGYCIRCREEIPQNPNDPLCSKDFKSWSRWGNREFPENIVIYVEKNQSSRLLNPFV